MFDRSKRYLICIILTMIVLGTAQAFARATVVELPVPKIAIYPGDAITGEMLAVKRFRAVNDRMPVVRESSAVIGKIARRTLIPGEPIPVTHLRDAELVKQGKPVRIVFTEGPMVITGVALPLQSGGTGDFVSLRNMDSGVVIKGVVEADGSVRIAGP